jgi:hypothetical protein
MASNHKCSKFRTVLKKNGIRIIVACRECGRKRTAEEPTDDTAKLLRK